MARIYGLSGRRLPVHPHPLPDELLSHWFMRLAHANGLKVQSLANYAFGSQSSFWSRDQDKLASPSVIERLSELTGQEPDDIRAHTLAAYEGTLYCSHNPFGNTRWILPLGVFHRTRRRFGQLYCPLCLATDRVPYFRRRWRLACYTICDRHGTMMRDCCNVCGSSVAFHRRELGRRNERNFNPIPICHNCGSDLSRDPAYGPPSGDIHALIALRSYLTFHDLGWTFCGSEVFQYEHLFTDALYRLCNFLAVTRGRRLLEAVEQEIHGKSLEALTPTQPREIEFRPLVDRHRLLEAAIWLLLEWPNRFAKTLKLAKATPSFLLLGKQKAPYWFVVGTELRQLNN